MKIKEFFKDIINLFLNYYIKIILDLKNKDEELKKELFNFSQVCISNISVIDCLESFNEIFNFCKNLPDEEKQFIQNMIYDLIITILNGKINSKNSSIEFNSVTFDKLIEMMKKHDIKFLIENFIPKLDNKIKEELRAKDLILFGDMYVSGVFFCFVVCGDLWPVFARFGWHKRVWKQKWRVRDVAWG